ncbi:NucA/NucB deoxyribonuclease domain-containing protein [Paenibacillus sp. PsM32]|uniref:NucA/NucB deoxyribonuclease domain-containing protein n=1 Tax=Paenibacillus nicotianae TaxID=1526551 RepID=A0ABW4UWW1_9BACL|nr:MULTISPECIES: NucA/NucB deoxyribonuclease domain-containing protein [unclassified Paenibacillus]MDN4617146.1 NucA/NucB deoxyribonuclease domain-containing protein [Paenibacillus sp. PsM32]MDQ1233007.1 hypothetical protein [Paenibacillus sp. SORGH_AS_0306]MDR6110052.1 hypothetical protein [Paenibacillus sp. SORGH_AS_0338]WDF49880.1 NucA/NucB deoxyribonuclease domain-containing protein [Paenibacillus sp. KACC 21273]
MSSKKIWGFVVTAILAGVIYLVNGHVDLGGILNPNQASNGQADYTLVVPADRYPKTAAHIKDAIAEGHSAICTIDRGGAKANRQLSLRGVATKKGYDRDEWPMAMCQEGGEGADIRYIKPSDNRGAGSWIGNQLDNYSDGTRVLFEVK